MPKKNSNWYLPPNIVFMWSIFLIVPLIAILTAMLLPAVNRLKTIDVLAFYYMGLGFSIIGFILLFVARIPLYRQRRFWTVGPNTLDRRHRFFYWLAYIFIIASILLLGVVWLKVI